jgi:hypothetical protein
MGPWYRDPRNKPTHHSQLLLSKGNKDIYWRKENFLNKWYGENCITTCRILQLDLYLSAWYKNKQTNKKKTNSKLIKDLNARPKTPRRTHRGNTSTQWYGQ